MEQVKDGYDDGGGHGDDQVLKARKRRKRKTKRLKTKVYLIGAFCFGTQDTKWVWVYLG
jgi:hypothetical protein